MTEDPAESTVWESGKAVPSKRHRRRVNLRRQPLTMPRWYALLFVCLSVVTIGAINLAWTSHVDGQREQAEREADRRWCLLLTTLDRAYSSVPPSTELGRQVAAAITRLTVDLNCKGGNA